MTPVWLAVTLEGERALRLCNRLIVLVARGRRIASAIRRGSRKSYLEDLNEAALVRAWAIMDAYLSDRADVLTRREMPIPTSPSAVMISAHSQAIGSIRGSFERLQAYWKAPLGLRFADYPDWSHLRAFRDLRNALAHRSGFVRLPLAGGHPPWIVNRLTKAGLSGSYSGKLPVYDSDFDELIRLVRDFVLWADRQLP